MPQGILGYAQAALGQGMENALSWKQLDQKDRALSQEDIKLGIEALDQMARKAHYEGQIDVARKQLAEHTREFDISTMNENASAEDMAKAAKGMPRLQRYIAAAAQPNGLVNLKTLGDLIRGEYQLTNTSMAVHAGEKEKDRRAEMDAMLSQALRNLLQQGASRPTVDVGEPDAVARERASVAYDRKNPEPSLGARFKKSILEMGPAALINPLGPLLGTQFKKWGRDIWKDWDLRNVKGKAPSVNPEGILGLAQSIDAANQLFGDVAAKGETGGPRTAGVLSSFYESAKQIQQAINQKVNEGYLDPTPELQSLNQAIERMGTTLQQNYYDPGAEQKGLRDLQRTILQIQGRKELQDDKLAAQAAKTR